jgi:hypothetical protein
MSSSKPTRKFNRRVRWESVASDSESSSEESEFKQESSDDDTGPVLDLGTLNLEEGTFTKDESSESSSESTSESESEEDYEFYRGDDSLIPEDSEEEEPIKPRPGCTAVEHTAIVRELYEDEATVEDSDKVFVVGDVNENHDIYAIEKGERIEALSLVDKVKGDKQYLLASFWLEKDRVKKKINFTDERGNENGHINLRGVGIWSISDPYRLKEELEFKRRKVRNFKDLKIVEYFPERDNGYTEALSSLLVPNVHTLITNLINRETVLFMSMNNVRKLIFKGTSQYAGDEYIDPNLVMRDGLRIEELHTNPRYLTQLSKYINPNYLTFLSLTSQSNARIDVSFPNLTSLMIAFPRQINEILHSAPQLTRGLKHLSVDVGTTSIDPITDFIQISSITSLELYNAEVVFPEGGETLSDVKSLLAGIKELRLSGRLQIDKLCTYYYEAFKDLETLILGNTKYFVTALEGLSYETEEYGDTVNVPNLPVQNIIIDSSHNYTGEYRGILIYDEDSPRIVCSKYQRIRHKSARFGSAR